MKHHRRKKLLRALHDLYLNNWKESATYRDQQFAIRSLEMVGNNLRKQYNQEHEQPQANQLTIW